MQRATDPLTTEARANYLRLRTALDVQRPLPLDIRQWLVDALDAYERGAGLERALGWNVEPGRAWQRPGRQLRRARMESLLLTVADCAGGRDSATATRISHALDGQPGVLPARALDFLRLLEREFGTEVPRTRTPILYILEGSTRAQRDGLVQPLV